MIDENHDEELNPELLAKVRSYYPTLEKERRRSKEISAGFYDKLAALNAGSIAISVSVGLAILTKQELRQFSHGLFALVLCFWLSLLTAIFHNFFRHHLTAKLDATYAGQEFIRNTIQAPMELSGADQNVMKQAREVMAEVLRQGPIAKQGVTMRQKRRLESVATVLGWLSVGSFLAGYTLVLIGAARLWL